MRQKEWLTEQERNRTELNSSLPRSKLVGFAKPSSFSTLAAFTCDQNTITVRPAHSSKDAERYSIETSRKTDAQTERHSAQEREAYMCVDGVL